MTLNNKFKYPNFVNICGQKIAIHIISVKIHSGYINRVMELIRHI